MRQILGLFFCIVCAPSSAAVFCVTTPQELRDAFVAAQNSTQNNTVKIARGSYNPGGTPFVYSKGGSTTDGNLIVRGGFNADCSTQIPDPSLTVLDGAGASGVLYVRSGVGFLTVEYLTVQNAGPSISGPTGLHVQTDSAGITVRFNIVRNNHSGPPPPLRVVAGAGTLHFDNNLAYGNSLDNSSGTNSVGTINISNQGSQTYVTNNTISGNTNTNTGFLDAVGGVYFSGNSGVSNVHFSNNIFWGNSNYGLYINSANSSTLTDNNIGSTNADVSCCGNGSVSPQFIDKDNGDYRLGVNSPLLASGTTSPPGNLPLTDLKGNPRFYNGQVDRGAYERGDVIFVNDFDR